MHGLQGLRVSVTAWRANGTAERAREARAEKRSTAGGAARSRPRRSTGAQPDLELVLEQRPWGVSRRAKQRAARRPPTRKRDSVQRTAQHTTPPPSPLSPPRRTRPRLCCRFPPAGLTPPRKQPGQGPLPWLTIHEVAFVSFPTVHALADAAPPFCSAAAAVAAIRAAVARDAAAAAGHNYSHGGRRERHEYRAQMLS